MYDLDIKEALSRLPKEVVDARTQRLKRAMDLSMKHEYLPEDLQVQDKILYSLYSDFMGYNFFRVALALQLLPWTGRA